MSNLEKICVGAALVWLVVAFIGHQHDIVNGLAKAMFGVSVIVFFISRFFGEHHA